MTEKYLFVHLSRKWTWYTAEPPNRGRVEDNINPAVVSFVERLSSFEVQNVLQLQGNKLLGP